MEPIRLCRHKESGPYGVWWPGDPAGEGGDFDYLLALPRADFDALVRERDAFAQHHGGHRPTCGGMDTAEQTCECGYLDGRVYREIAAERDAATARAEKAEALLREARDLMDYVGCQDCLADNPMLTGQWDRAKGGIDALLAEAAGPTDDDPTEADRRGEDGEAIGAATGGA